MPYDPGQPRDPKGSKTGGQWSGGFWTKTYPAKNNDPAGGPMPKIETMIDHGPRGWTPEKNDITRQDRNAIVELQQLRGQNVDIVRSDPRAGKDSRSYTETYELMSRMKAEGQLENLTIAVEMDGSITLLDGTHRVYIADLLGWKGIRANVRYFGGSDEKHLLRYLNE